MTSLVWMVFAWLSLEDGALAGSPYTASAGRSVPTTLDEAGVERKVASDGYGNAAGNQHDLAVDGAFEGQTIVLLQLYTEPAFDFALPRAALAEKGFSVVRWSNGVPGVEELATALEKASQLWIVSGDRQHLTEGHIAVIRRFWEAGHGLYLWGDNPPYVHDANAVGQALFGATMDAQSYVQAEKVVTLQRSPGEPGFLRDHLLTTGLEFLYEGHTIPALTAPKTFTPLIVGSDRVLVAAFYDQDGRRAIVDTGFTRLYLNWDTAGTGRYVKNAAAWLANAERFGMVEGKAQRQAPRAP